MADGRHIEDRFWPYICAVLPNRHETWRDEAVSHADRGHVTKIANFEKIAYGRHFKIEDGNWLIITISQIQDGERRPS